VDLADDVEEEVLGGAHGGDQAGDLPTVLGEDRGDQVALGGGVAEGGERGFRTGEVEEAVEVLALAHGVEGGGLAGGVPDDAFAGQAEVVAHGEAREAVAEVVVELLLGAEDEVSDAGVQAVGADDEVERAAGAAGEGHVHAVVVIVEDGDAVVEEELDVVADGGVEDLREIASAHLQVAAFDTACHGLRADRGDQAAVGVEEGDQAGLDVGGPQVRHQPHSVDHVQCRAADVDGVAAAAQGVGFLHDRDVEAVSVQPVGQRGARDAGAGDQDRAHVHSSVRQPSEFDS
jgi:hypothetical protein